MFPSCALNEVSAMSGKEMQGKRMEKKLQVAQQEQEGRKLSLLRREAERAGAVHVMVRRTMHEPSSRVERDRYILDVILHAGS